jgi:hypothetical protein
MKSRLGRLSSCSFFAERFRSREGEHETLLTRQITFERLPSSVLLALVPADSGLLGDVIVIFIPDFGILGLLKLQ